MIRFQSVNQNIKYQIVSFKSPVQFRISQFLSFGNIDFCCEGVYVYIFKQVTPWLIYYERHIVTFRAKQLSCTTLQYNILYFPLIVYFDKFVLEDKI